MSNTTPKYFTQDKAQQPKVGISACLIGENVRYDGGNKAHLIIQKEVAPWINLQPFCPEVAANLGIPRPPVNLVEVNDEISALGVEDTTLNVTASLSETSLLAISSWGSSLRAYIVKSRSPSCGAGSTPIYNQSQEIIRAGDGLFVAALKKTHPHLLIVDESFFSCKDKARAFLETCYGENK